MRRSERIQKRLSFMRSKESKTEETKGDAPKEKKKSFYYWHYKLLLIIPMLLLVLSIVYLGVMVATTGDFINKGISLKGGTSITVTKAGMNNTILEQQLKAQFPKNEINIRVIEESGTQIGFIIESDVPPEDIDLSTAFIDAIKQDTGANDSEVNVETIGVSLGNSFFKQTMISLVVAFILMAIVVFLYFKIPIPSGLVVLSAFSDIVVTIAIIDVLGIKVGTAGIAALLMLIGYSVDTDIVLTMRVLKRKNGTVYDQTISAFKTGMMMNIATLVAVTAAAIIATSPTLREIMIIVIVGILVDMMMTWLQNAGLLRWYLEHKGEQ
jgi:preprotein translocase subunit SecF